jgi:hypothetical protein
MTSTYARAAGFEEVEVIQTQPPETPPLCLPGGVCEDNALRLLAFLAGVGRCATVRAGIARSTAEGIADPWVGHVWIAEDGQHYDPSWIRRGLRGVRYLDIPALTTAWDDLSQKQQHRAIESCKIVVGVDRKKTHGHPPPGHAVQIGLVRRAKDIAGNAGYKVAQWAGSRP